jgi:hypothetical protein
MYWREFEFIVSRLFLFKVCTLQKKITTKKKIKCATLVVKLFDLVGLRPYGNGLEVMRDPTLFKFRN